jgi:hypothetical protein
LNHLDRNLDALTQELAARCQQVFIRASGAASRSATFSFGPSSVASLTASARPAYQSSNHLLVRERIIVDKNKVSDNAAIGNFMQLTSDKAGNHSQYLALYSPSGHRTFRELFDSHIFHVTEGTRQYALFELAMVS